MVDEYLGKETIISKVKKDKLYFFILGVIIFLAIYIRVIDFNEVGYVNDDIDVIPTGLLWFYPHEYYPGLSGEGKPTLGHFLIGASCMLSGQDFSAVTNIKPMFYPDRPIYLGEPLTKAGTYCHISVVIFGILFFVAIILLAFSLLGKYSAMFFISFFAFFQFVLSESRWIHEDIIMYFFATLGILFLWKAYKLKKGEKRELMWFILAFAFFALAFATKMPAGLFLFFGIFILLEKYRTEMLCLLKPLLEKLKIRLAEKIESGEYKTNFIKILLVSLVVFFFILLSSFEFSIKNILDVYRKFNMVNLPAGYGKLSTISINLGFFNTIYEFLLGYDFLSFFLFLIGIFVFLKLLFKKRNKQEIFILYLTILTFFSLLLFEAVNWLRVFFIFSLGWALTTSLIFDTRFFKTKKFIFYIFIIFYLTYVFSSALLTVPYFEKENNNLILCSLKDHPICTASWGGKISKTVANFFRPMLEENETFFPPSVITSFYIRRSDALIYYLFTEDFRKQVGRDPTLEDYLAYYRPENRTVRYIFSEVPYIGRSGIDLFIKNYKPNYVIKLKNREVAYVYDLFNLEKLY